MPSAPPLKMCEKPPQSGTDILFMPSLFCFIPEKLSDLSEWLRPRV